MGRPRFQFVSGNLGATNFSRQGGHKMATCNVCGKAKAAFLSSMCNACMDNKERSGVNFAASSTSSGGAVAASSEGSTASFIGNAVIWLSFIASVICVIAFGRVEIPNGPYSTQIQWSTLLVSVYVAAGLNGMFFGYLLAKVGSVLSRLDSGRNV